MCHDDHSRPPGSSRSEAIAQSGHLTLTGGDGNQLLAFHASSAAPKVGVVILPDVRGLHPYYGSFAGADAWRRILELTDELAA